MWRVRARALRRVHYEKQRKSEEDKQSEEGDDEVGPKRGETRRDERGEVGATRRGDREEVFVPREEGRASQKIRRTAEQLTASEPLRLGLWRRNATWG